MKIKKIIKIILLIILCIIGICLYIYFNHWSVRGIDDGSARHISIGDGSIKSINMAVENEIKKLKGAEPYLNGIQLRMNSLDDTNKNKEKVLLDYTIRNNDIIGNKIVSCAIEVDVGKESIVWVLLYPTDSCYSFHKLDMTKWNMDIKDINSVANDYINGNVHPSIIKSRKYTIMLTENDWTIGVQSNIASGADAGTTIDPINKRIIK